MSANVTIAEFVKRQNFRQSPNLSMKRKAVQKKTVDKNVISKKNLFDLKFIENKTNSIKNDFVVKKLKPFFIKRNKFQIFQFQNR